MNQQMQPRSLLSITLLCVSYVAFCVWTTMAQEESGGPELIFEDADADASQTPMQCIGVHHCALCHDKPSSKFVAEFSVSLNEVHIWDEKDKHRSAYDVLKGERAQRMGEILGIDVTTSADCLSCHAVAKEQIDCGEKFNVTLGVSCEACHGPSSKWVGTHWQNDWISRTPDQEKVAAGLYDVRDPVARTRLCLSCHLGHSGGEADKYGPLFGQRKIVTHDMYAAGHPPLPGFEVETFATNMPPHWALEGERAGLEIARSVLIGGLVALRDSVHLLQTEATRAAAEPADGSKVLWPELALFDCRACHHDLRVNSWRQTSQQPLRPGRPTIRYWPSALARLAFEHTGRTSTDLDRTLEPLYAELGRQPFGAPERISDASSAAVRELDVVIDSLAQQEISHESTKVLLKRVAETAASKAVDYDTARQLGWAFTVIYKGTADQANGTAEIAAIVDQLSAELGLALTPQGREHTIDEHLAASLRRAREYDPERFQQQMKGLSDFLAKDQ